MGYQSALEARIARKTTRAITEYSMIEDGDTAVREFFSRVYEAALAAGGSGIFGVSFLDSSFVPLPEISDLMVVVMVMQHQAWMPYYAAMATAGSIAGCYVIYALARKGGSGFLQRRMSLRRGDQVLALYRRYGLLALMIPAVLPPPAPFKVFVLLAGVAGVSPLKFVLGVGLARAVRYLVLGGLTIAYGETALGILQTHGPLVAGIVVGLIAMGSVAYWLVKRRRRPQQID